MEFKNCYKRKLLGCALTWAVVIFPCLYLLFSTITLVAASERVRHHHVDDDIYVSQLEKSALEESSKRSVVTCPNCLYNNKNSNVNNKKISKIRAAETDNSLRLEAIKRQILSKLGLKHKPNVTHSLPREVIMETLSRAEDNSDFFRNSYSEENISTTSARTAAVDNSDFDDFYGRTSEIISFAEQGNLL